MKTKAKECWTDRLRVKHECWSTEASTLTINWLGKEYILRGQKFDVGGIQDIITIMSASVSDKLLYIIGRVHLGKEPECDCEYSPNYDILIVAKCIEGNTYMIHVWHELFYKETTKYLGLE